ncbi:hypothetical protein RHMOL_Rhmol08G0224300 [Rhododendron molle]|uniref:Uncharacterized protein n=1 Tax=Rhododendron molle TaxID=49168 RepID=A0ACC0MR28_RHOML|nr:hypothetical protein RHMOL_Rhmol08G0224300 [Rhododendron molle]
MKSVRFGRFFTIFCTEPNQSVFENQEPKPTSARMEPFGSVVIKAVRFGRFCRFADLGPRRRSEEPMTNLTG